MSKNWKRWTAGLLAVVLAAGLLAGCSQTAGSAGGAPSSAPPAAAPTPTPEPADQGGSSIKVMDFSAPLDLKKPETPIPETPYVLFLGNSFIFYNDMPSVFASLSYSGGIEADVYELSDGGYHLSYFCDPDDELGAVAIDALKTYEWDYVILQEQSRLPTAPEMVEGEMLPAARTLDEMIRAANGQTVMLMTWAYEEGDDWVWNGQEKVTTREEMQTELARSYMQVADELDALLAPAGIAFIRCAQDHPEIDLWDDEDGMHPTPAGTYLGACVLYATLYDQSPAGLSYVPEELDAETAAVLQQTAADLVLGTGG